MPSAKPSARRLAFIVAGLSMIGPFSIDTYLPAFPAIGASLGASPVEVQQTLTAYLFTFSAMILWHGAISDALGRRSVVLGGMALYGVASLFCVFATHIEVLWAGRALQGMVGGVGVVLGRAIVRDLFDGASAQRLLASVAVIFAIAPAIAPVIGGWISAWFGWRGIFVFLVLVAGLLFWMCWRYLPETLPPGHRQPLSVANLWQGYRSMLGSAAFLRLSIALAANFSGFFIYILSSPVFLIEHLKLSPQAFAVLFVPAVLGMILGSLINRRCAGRLSQERTVALGFAIMIVAALVNVALNFSMAPQLPWAIVPLFVYVTGMALTMPCLQLLAMDLFPDRHGMASSCQSLFQSGLNTVVAGAVAPLLWVSTQRLALGMIGFLALGLLAFASSSLVRPRTR